MKRSVHQRSNGIELLMPRVAFHATFAYRMRSNDRLGCGHVTFAVPVLGRDRLGYVALVGAFQAWNVFRFDHFGCGYVTFADWMLRMLELGYLAQDLGVNGDPRVSLARFGGSFRVEVTYLVRLSSHRTVNGCRNLVRRAVQQ